MSRRSNPPSRRIAAKSECRLGPGITGEFCWNGTMNPDCAAFVIPLSGIFNETHQRQANTFGFPLPSQPRVTR